MERREYVEELRSITEELKMTPEMEVGAREVIKEDFDRKYPKKEKQKKHKKGFPVVAMGGPSMSMPSKSSGPRLSGSSKPSGGMPLPGLKMPFGKAPGKSK